MTYDKGPHLATLQLKDECDIEDIENILEKFEGDDSVIIVHRWSDGEVDIRKQVNRTLIEENNDEKEDSDDG